jgi:hypothetical protein
MIRRFGVLIGLVLAAGCTSWSLASLEGQSEASAIARLGPPTSTYPEGDAHWLVWSSGTCRQSVEVRSGTVTSTRSSCRQY